MRGENSTLPLSAPHAFAWDVKAAQIDPVNISAPTILISLPEELTTFQVVIESG